jgi:hypothetical protein
MLNVRKLLLCRFVPEGKQHSAIIQIFIGVENHCVKEETKDFECDAGQVR